MTRWHFSIKLFSRGPQLNPDSAVDTRDCISEEQTWNSEDTRLYSFTVFFGPWQAVVYGSWL
jgi:hypothetical protein